MGVTRLRAALIRAATDLKSIDCRWSLIGGLAIAVRVAPRQTRDIDVAVAVDDEAEAEGVVSALFRRGYRQMEGGIRQDRATGRLWVVRLITPGEDAEETVIDLLFYSSRIEPEIVAESEPVEVSPGLVIPVAKTGHLLALKLLAGRTQDLADVETMMQVIEPEEIQRARQALRLIEVRQGILERDLQAELDQFLSRRE